MHVGELIEKFFFLKMTEGTEHPKSGQWTVRSETRSRTERKCESRSKNTKECFFIKKKKGRVLRNKTVST